jgi:ribose-phosphate pyrophosphokinase
MTVDPPDLLLFGLGSTRPRAERVAGHLGLTLAPCEERDFEDGEHKTRPLVNVRGRDVYVMHALHGEPGFASGNDKLCRLLFFAGSLRDADAARVTAVVPYLCYARKDRRTKPRDPVTTRYVATLFEAVGIERVLVVDVHNPAAYQNAFRRGPEHLEARPLLIEAVLDVLEDRPPVVVSPDVGGVHRADRFAQGLGKRLGGHVPVAFVEKRRSEGVVSGGALVGDVSGRLALVIDDLVTTGTTMSRAAAACMDHGADGVIAVATHGVFSREAGACLADAPFERLIVTDSVAPKVPPQVADRVRVVDLAGLLAEAVARLHTGGSLVELAEM